METMFMFTIATILGVGLLGAVGLLILYKVLSKIFANWKLQRDAEILKMASNIANIVSDIVNIKESVFAQEESIEKLQYELDSKLGSDIEYFADDVLVQLTALTPFTELKRYLNKKRDLLVGEVKRLMSMGIAYAQPEILQKSWDTVRDQLKEYSSNLSLEFTLYQDYSEPLREVELAEFETNLMHIIKSGNGSKDKLFLKEVKIYIRKQLEFTFKDYQDYIVKKASGGRTDTEKNTTEYLLGLVTEGSIELALYHLQNIVKRSRNQELRDSLTLLSAKYHLYQKDENSGTVPVSELKIEIAKINKALISYIHTAIGRIQNNI